MNFLSTISELKDVSQYVREYSGNPTFAVPSDGKIAIFDNEGKEQYAINELRPGRWALTFTPFAFLDSGWNHLRAYRCLLLYNTAIEEKVLSGSYTIDYLDDYSAREFNGFNIKVGTKIVKVLGIGEDFYVQRGEETEDHIEFFLIDENIDNMRNLANIAARDLKARRVLAQLWNKYFPDTLIVKNIHNRIVVVKVPLSRIEPYNLPAVGIIGKVKTVNVSRIDDEVIMWTGSVNGDIDFKIEPESKKSLANKDIANLLFNIYSDFGGDDDKDLYLYFAKIMNYLYDNKLNIQESIWLDNKGNMYIVKDTRKDDAYREFIDRWDPHDPLNKLMPTDINRFIPIQ